jgi:PAS domain-containing protein
VSVSEPAIAIPAGPSDGGGADRARRAARHLAALLEPAAGRPRGEALALPAALLLVGLALGACLATPAEDAPPFHLLVLPVLVVAAARGRLAGLAAALGAVAAQLALHVLAGRHTTLTGHVAHAVVVVAVGVVAGALADRARARAAVLRAVGATQAALGDGVLVADAAGRILHATAAAAAIHRRSADELGTLRLPDLLDPAEHPRFRERARMRAAGHAVPSRVKALGRDAEGARVEIEAASAQVELDGVRLLLSLERDTTALHGVQRSLGREREVLDAVLEASPVPTAVLDGGGHLVCVNGAAERLVGRDREVLLGRTPWGVGLVGREHAGGAAAALRAGERALQSVRLGDHDWTLSALRDGGGNVVGVVAVAAGAVEAA